MHMEEPCFDFLRTKETLGSVEIYLFIGMSVQVVSADERRWMFFLPHPTGIRCILLVGTHPVSLASRLLLRLKQPNSSKFLNVLQNQVGQSHHS